MSEACYIDMMATSHWLVGLYLGIGFVFSTAGLGIALANCNHKHDLEHVSTHVLSWMIDTMVWPWKAALIWSVARARMKADLERKISRDSSEEDL